MNVFAAGDFHQSEELRESVIEQANSGTYDLVILTGDYEDPDYYESIASELDMPFVAVTGNWDFGFEPPENGAYTNLFNYKEVEFDDYRIVLLGSVYPDDFMDRIKTFFEDVPREKRIVVTHYPPHMLGDLTRMGTRAGFTEFRELILREKPALWLCGHIHEDYGRFELLKTTVLNCSSKESGKGWDITINDEGVDDVEQIVLNPELVEEE